MGRGKASATALAVAAAVVMIAQQVGAKALRDTLFLSNFAAAELPKVMAASAVVSIPAILASSQILAKRGPARIVPGTFFASAGLFGLEWWAYRYVPEPTAVLVFLHVAVIGSIAVSGFWSAVNESFDPHSAKRAVARIAGGAALGGLIGGVLSERAAAWLDAHSALLGLMVMNVACALFVRRFAAGSSPMGAKIEPANGVSELGRSAYLRRIAAFVAGAGCISAIADYVLKASAAASFAEEAQLLRFFGLFYMATSILTFVVQSAVVRRSLEGFGLGMTVGLLPAVVLLTGVLATGFTRLWTVVLLRSAETIAQNSFFRSAYELLYLPVAPAQKRSTKALIDVGCDRLGDVAGSAAILAVLAWVPNGKHALLLGLVTGIAAVLLAAAAALHRGYVAQLAKSLREGQLELEERDVLDATTRVTLSQTLSSIDREQLLSQIERLRRSWQDAKSAGGGPVEPVERDRARALADEAKAMPLVSQIEILLERDPRRVRSLLERQALDLRTVAFLIPLLETDPLAPAIQSALKSVVPRVIGQLSDALLDPSAPVKVRRRLPRVLQECASPRVVRVLGDALSDPSFDVRFRAARALSELTARHPRLQVPPDLALAAARRELESAPRDGRDRDPASARAQRLRLRYVFLLLGLAIDREALRLSLLALEHDDAALRGTALEYLENVLPEPIRGRIWPELARRGPQVRSVRTQEQLLDELRTSVNVESADTQRAAQRKPN